MGEWLIALVAAVAAFGVGLGVGWLAGGRRARGNDLQNWKTRLAARDEDLRRSENALGEATIEVETLRNRLREAEMAPAQHDRRPEPPDADLPAQLEALERELAEAEDEIVRLRSEAEQPSGDAGLRRRLEELEAELATLESLRCPDPTAHRRPGGSP
jgi:chromosome segregation ATPase